MALQGTLETFALPDVMRLLASTKKTGCLRLSGSRGSGSIWVDGGQLVAGEVSGSPHATEPVEVVFELLRFPDGDFAFEADLTTSTSGPPSDVEPTLADAEKLLDEWRAIEAVVPSLDVWVALAEELPAEEVTIDRERWRLLAAIGGGTTVRHLGDRLAKGELPISRQVKELVDLALASVGDAPAAPASTPAAAPAPVAEPAPATVIEPEPFTREPEEEPAGSIVDSLIVEVDEPAPAPSFEPTPAVADDFERFDPDALVIGDPADLQPVPSEPAAFEQATVASAPESGNGLGDPSDAAEIARQLANLSPKAAKAVAAAAKATTQEERERALADVDDDEDPINRELLIKFLGSVNG